jgi:hypothetical protein
MRKIFIGMIFVFLDFNIDIGTSRIGLIPDFIGYLFIIQGLAELSDKSRRFSAARPFAVFMAVYTAAIYVCNLLGLVVSMGVLPSLLLGAVTIFVSLYVSYQIVMGIKETETTEARFLNADALYRSWRLYVFFSVVSLALVLIPVLALICIIACFAAGIYFLVCFNRSKNLYYNP